MEIIFRFCYIFTKAQINLASWPLACAYWDAGLLLGTKIRVSYITILVQIQLLWTAGMCSMNKLVILASKYAFTCKYFITLGFGENSHMSFYMVTLILCIYKSDLHIFIYLQCCYYITLNSNWGINTNKKNPKMLIFQS